MATSLSICNNIKEQRLFPHSTRIPAGTWVLPGHKCLAHRMCRYSLCFSCLGDRVACIWE